MSSSHITQERVSPAIENKTLTKNRKSLLLVIFAFALPVILAKLALDQNWLALGVTNNGTLLKNELTLKKLGITNAEFSQQWLILYALPKQCLAPCLKALETVHNTYVVLGKDMPRVTPVLLKQQEFNQQQTQQLTKSQWHILPMTEQSKNLISQSQIFIVDPLGNVILSHLPPIAGTTQQGSFGKAILADMKKLLKYSKVG